MRLIIKLICLGGLLLILFLSSGCAFSVFQKELNYSYQGELPEASRPITKTVSVGKFKDLRDVTTPKMIMHMRNANGYITTGGWEAEKPIADIVRDAIMEGIELSKLNLTENGNLLITGEVIDFSGESKMDMSLGITFRSKLTVKLKLTDVSKKKVLWKDTFFGVGVAKKVTHSGEHAKDSFVSALNDMISHVFTDDYFLQQFE